MREAIRENERKSRCIVEVGIFLKNYFLILYYLNHANIRIFYYNYNKNDILYRNENETSIERNIM